MISAFGVDHGTIAKADQKPDKVRRAEQGGAVAATAGAGVAAAHDRVLRHDRGKLRRYRDLRDEHVSQWDARMERARVQGDGENAWNHRNFMQQAAEDRHMADGFLRDVRHRIVRTRASGAALTAGAVASGIAAHRRKKGN